jgi:rare lipoprotein A
MTDNWGRGALKSGAIISLIAVAVALAGCTSHEPKVSVSKRPASKEYFPESVYGKASPRMTNLRSRLPRGGGRDQLGKPYQVAGKWYYPKEQPGYSKKGKASWYGDAFHGRLTANGEIYDMTHLSAAHPTMPLPSYARVTNLKNGSSVVVRVNDRGPFAHGRIIDLSSRAAEMLDYKHSGIAEVKVDYVGRAPLEGSDDEYLLASYRPGRNGPDPSDGLATGVMIAMAGPTPTASLGASQAVAFPGQLTSSGTAGSAVSLMEFPESGPIIADRPLARLEDKDGKLAALGYAEEQARRLAAPFDGLTKGGLSPSQMVSALPSEQSRSTEYVSVGTFADRAEAERLVSELVPLSLASIERTSDGSKIWYSVTARPYRAMSIDDLLRSVWDTGATDAFIVRN